MAEHNANTRLPADAVPEITGLRFLPQDTPAGLLNISATGLLAESAARLLVGKPAAVHVDGGFSPDVVTGRVARCEVAAMRPDGTLRYHIAVEFDSPLTLRRVATPNAIRPTDEVRNRW